ncbi:peptidase M19 [Defluviimonas sp. 20V17]|uniref:Dipeptidase n=1 Tax=Allgaiera indica TaxID=765699 RepID=A0AAN4USD5_9RHOB|nr:membrane dipeptidase [Allgaiera indica]KDB02296.1 peptidase M19 [Defluviimonas sp. 20V17]GHE02794.1 dipeptidase [Allgaiera indica]SDX17634.1 Zn-dependent dipeptidase, dipeptidase homolog [Allgaiera indica]
MMLGIGLGVLVLLTLGLAGFLIFGPAIAERGMNAVLPGRSTPVPETARALHARLVVGDWHCDSLLWNRDLLKRGGRGHVDFPRLREGNVALQVFTTVTCVPAGMNVIQNQPGADRITLLAMAQLWPARTWRSLCERGLYQAQRMHRYAARAPEAVKVLRDRADLRDLLAARAGGAQVVGAVLGAEGAHVLDGRIENLDRLWQAGFRLIGLHHFLDTEMGGSLHGASGAGLTDYGRGVVARMVEMGFIIDLTHSSEQTARDVMAMTDVPLVVSHTGICSHCQSPRNFPDPLMAEIMARGGVAGIGYWAEVIGDASPRGIAGAVVAAVGLLGEDHVSLGSDFDGAVAQPFDASDLAQVTAALMAAGLEERVIAKVMGGNMVRLLEQMLPEAA